MPYNKTPEVLAFRQACTDGEVQRMAREGYSYVQIAKRYGVSRTSVYNYCKRDENMKHKRSIVIDALDDGLILKNMLNTLWR